MSRVQKIVLDDEAEGQRLDRWLKRFNPHVTQSQVEKMCRKGDIRLDGGRVRANSRLAEGQTLRLPPLPDAAQKRVAPVPALSEQDVEFVRSLVIYRDDDIIALNKPPGLAVQGGSGQTRHLDMLSNGLRFDRDEKPRLVHRLDRDTSGVIIMARSAKAAADLTRAFQSKNTRKIYWAAVAGMPNPKAGTIRYGLVKAAGHGPGGAGEKMICIPPSEMDETPDAKRATSDYMVIDGAAQRAAWVALSPITGRTHQLRAHMAEIGHPVVGDGKYGTNSQENDGDGWGAQLGGSVSRKMHLHARSLSLTHPRSGARLVLTAPLPEHMARTWELFGWDQIDPGTDPFEDLE